MNASLRKVCVVASLVMAASGLSHGVFEILQGTATTDAPGVVAAIGEDQRMWVHGEEPAFTVLPTFLATGVAAVVVSVAIAVWSFVGLSRPHGAIVHLLLFVLLFLSGGGIAQVPFFIILCGFATRVRDSRGGSRTHSRSRWLARTWVPLLVMFVVLMVLGLQAAVTGFVPFVANEDMVLAIMLVSVGLALVASPLCYLGALADDVAGTPPNGAAT